MGINNENRNGLVDFVAGKPENTTLEVQQVPSLPVAVALILDEITSENSDTFALVDLDGTLSTGVKSKVSKFPLVAWVARLMPSEYFAQETMYALSLLDRMLEGKVCIATNRAKGFRPPWDNAGLLRSLDRSLSKQGLEDIQKFWGLNRFVQNRFIPFSREEFDKMVRWIVSRQDLGKNELNLVMVADFDLFGMNWSEKPFLTMIANRLRKTGIEQPINLVHMCIK